MNDVTANTRLQESSSISLRVRTELNATMAKRNIFEISKNVYLIYVVFKIYVTF